MKELTIRIIKWIFYLPISLVGGIVTGVICQWIMPYVALIVLWLHGVDYYQGPVLFNFERTIYDVKMTSAQYIVIAATIIVSFVVLGVVAGGIAGKMCPARNPHIGAITITFLLFIGGCFSIIRIWDSDRLFICITSIIGYVVALISSYIMAYSIKKEL